MKSHVYLKVILDIKKIEIENIGSLRYIQKTW